MKAKKPEIEYDKNQGHFLADGVIIGDDIARDIWDDGTGDWTQAAFQEMARRVLA